MRITARTTAGARDKAVLMLLSAQTTPAKIRAHAAVGVITAWLEQREVA